jgi:hypothetical protein
LKERQLEATIREHLKFFDSKKRTEALQAMELADTNKSGFKLAMLCVLAGLKVSNPDRLIRQVLIGGLLELENVPWIEI